MARHTRDLPGQKNAAQMQVITIKVFVPALQNTSGIHITIITRDHNPSFKFRMEGSTELRAGATYLHDFLFIFFKSRLLFNTTKGKVFKKTDTIFHLLQAIQQGI